MKKNIFIGSTSYPVQREQVYIGSVRKVKKPPIVRVTISRGKTYDPNITIKSASDVEKAFRTYLSRNSIETQEKMLAMYTGAQNQIIGIYQHSVGATNMTVAETKLIVKGALDVMATGVITAHNHPSGTLRASEQDIAMAKRLKNALEYHGISLLDNFILTKNGFTTF